MDSLSEQLKYQNPHNPYANLPHQSILEKTDFTKKKIVLKQEKRDNHGRFLDNHFSKDVHGNAFCISMKAPDNRYRYSQQVGLSYKFQNVGVLERLDVESQNSKRFEFVRFAEFNDVKDGQIMISIEHCVDCHLHSQTTNHDENKYKAFAQHLQAAIKEQFPTI